MRRPKPEPTHPAGAKSWTVEEEELLRHLRTETELTYDQMTPYFSGRSSGSIASHWSYNAKFKPSRPSTQCGKSLPAAALGSAKVDHCPVAVTPGRQIEGNSDIDELQEIDNVFQSSKPVVRCNQRNEPSYIQSKQNETLTRHPLKVDLLCTNTNGSPDEDLADVNLESSEEPVAKAVFRDTVHTRKQRICRNSTSPTVSFPVSPVHSTSATITPSLHENEEASDVVRIGRSRSPPTIRLLDDSSEDELATPFRPCERPNDPIVTGGFLGSRVPRFDTSTLLTRLPRSPAPDVSATAVLSTQFPSAAETQDNDLSEDELSMPFRKWPVFASCKTKSLSSNRRKSSLL